MLPALRFQFVRGAALRSAVVLLVVCLIGGSQGACSSAGGSPSDDSGGAGGEEESGGGGGSISGTGGTAGADAIDAGGSVAGAAGHDAATEKPDAGLTKPDAANPITPTSPLYMPPTMGGDFDFSDKTWAYPDETKSVLGTPLGTVVSDTFATSKIYPGRSYKYSVYIPKQYDGSTPAALMVWQDGNKALGTFRVPLVYNNLIHQGRLPVTINIFVEPSSQADRSDEYDSINDKYVRFLIEELIPWATTKNNLKISGDPEAHGIGGHSSGGAAAFTAAWLRPDYFRRVVTGNGSFVGLRGADQYPALIKSAANKPLRVTLLSGDADLSGFGGWLPANRAMAAALKQKNYQYRFTYAKQVGHDEKYFSMIVAFDLLFAWQGFTAGAN
ncbi:MAG: alpha/beta hydrolase-fold protein [Deltaproteobacteria bacterium]|nr:alpha/beta hydrolase-fold protein [Deltaproteobacteria bacterium]